MSDVRHAYILRYDYTLLRAICKINVIYVCHKYYL